MVALYYINILMVTGVLCYYVVHIYYMNGRYIYTCQNKIPHVLSCTGSLSREREIEKYLNRKISEPKQWKRIIKEKLRRKLWKKKPAEKGFVN